MWGCLGEAHCGEINNSTQRYCQQLTAGWKGRGPGPKARMGAGLTRAGIDPELGGALQGVDDGLLAVLAGAVKVSGIHEQHRGSYQETKVGWGLLIQDTQPKGSP